MRRARFVPLVSALVCGAVLASLFAPPPVRAQGPEPIVAGVDRMALSTDETLEFTVVVSAGGLNVAQPRLPAMDGFTIVGRSTQTQISVVNGVMSNDIIYKYRLQPYRTGDLVIGPVTLEANGQTYQTNPITIQVSQGTGTGRGPDSNFQAPSQLGDKDFFVEALVDNPTPYVGEQIRFTFRYYEAADALRPFGGLGGQPDYRPPALTGFWTEGDTDVGSHRLPVDGRIYTVTELSNILFPTTAGELTIDPATITIPGFGLQGETMLQTEPVVVNVKPLPAGAPDTFSGAVGQFTIQSGVDLTQTRVDEPVTLSVTVAGQGNIGTLGDPAAPELAGWRAFASDARTDTRVENEMIVGERTIEQLMVPTTAGEFTLPAIEYSYFDPGSETYQTVATQPIVLSVAPGADGAVAPAPPAAPAPNVQADDVQAEAAPAAAAANVDTPADLPVALATLKHVPTELGRVRPSLTSQWWYWALWVMPLGVLAGSMVWQRRRRYLHTHAAAVRSSHALKHARRSLDGLARQDDAAHVFGGVYATVTTFLGAKLQRPVAGMTRSSLTTTLASAGVDDASCTRTAELLDAAEHGRYSPAGLAFSSPDALIREADTLLGLLEPALTSARKGSK